MKSIFRYVNISVLLAAVLAISAVAGFAQAPCEDAAGMQALDAKFRENYNKDLAARKIALDAGKSYIEKYGSCEVATDFVTYLKNYLPKMEDRIKADELKGQQAVVLTRFDNAMKAKNWDETYTSGKEILAQWPDQFRAVELVLGSIGYDEMFAGNTKYVDETLKYALQSLNDLEAGKEFKPNYGVGTFSYKSKDDAIAWMNITIGSLYQIGKKNKSNALPYLYKATQAPTSSDVSKNPNPYEFIGSYYFDELNKLVEQIQAKAKLQSDTDTPEVAQKKVDEIKALVAQSNGIAERAMDAFSRAYTLGIKPEYKTKMKGNVEAAYKLRFGKTEGVDAWMATVNSKPFPNPSSPIAPISDPEPVKAADAAAAPATTTTPAKTGTIKPATSKPGVSNK